MTDEAATGRSAEILIKPIMLPYLSHQAKHLSPALWQAAPAIAMAQMNKSQLYTNNFIFALDTGMGKSRVAMALANALIAKNANRKIKIHMYFSNEKLMIRDKQIIREGIKYSQKTKVTYVSGMIPQYDSTKFDKNDYFIVDECDSIMLDESIEFHANYIGMQSHVGGFFFLTATNFEEEEGISTHEEQFINSLPNLKILKCKPQRTKKEHLMYEKDFQDVDAMVSEVKSRSAANPVIIWAFDEVEFEVKKMCGREKRKTDLETALKVKLFPGKAGVIDLYDASTVDLRQLDKKVHPYFQETIAHYPIYFVTGKSNRGFDLSC